MLGAVDDPQPTILVVDNPAENRYEVRVDGELAGFAAYEDLPGRRVFMHAEIDDAYGGRGLGSTLVGQALDDVRARAMKATPQCPFVATYVRRHREYEDLVDWGHTTR